MTSYIVLSNWRIPTKRPIQNNEEGIWVSSPGTEVQENPRTVDLPNEAQVESDHITPASRDTNKDETQHFFAKVEILLTHDNIFIGNVPPNALVLPRVPRAASTLLPSEKGIELVFNAPSANCLLAHTDLLSTFS
jgi:hypothetical protein